MIAKETRIFVFGGKEYRITKGHHVGDIPKNVTDAMSDAGLVDKPAKSTARRKR